MNFRQPFLLIAFFFIFCSKLLRYEHNSDFHLIRFKINFFFIKASIAKNSIIQSITSRSHTPPSFFPRPSHNLDIFFLTICFFFLGGGASGLTSGVEPNSFWTPRCSIMRAENLPIRGIYGLTWFDFEAKSNRSE